MKLRQITLSIALALSDAKRTAKLRALLEDMPDDSVMSMPAIKAEVQDLEPNYGYGGCDDACFEKVSDGDCPSHHEYLYNVRYGCTNKVGMDGLCMSAASECQTSNYENNCNVIGKLGIKTSVFKRIPCGFTTYLAHGDGPFLGGEIGTFDPDTNTYTTLGTYGSLSGMVFNGQNLVAYDRMSDSLKTIDPESGLVLGAVSLNLVGATTTQLTDLAFDPTSGLYYGVNNADPVSNTQLFLLDISSGTGTSVGTTPAITGQERQIAFDSSGNLYLHASATGNPATSTFHIIDKTDASLISTIPGGIGGGSLGLGWNPEDGLLYGSRCCSALIDGQELVKFNPSTGSATTVFDFNDFRGIEDVAFVPSI